MTTLLFCAKEMCLGYSASNFRLMRECLPSLVALAMPSAFLSNGGAALQVFANHLGDRLKALHLYGTSLQFMRLASAIWNAHRGGALRSLRLVLTSLLTRQDAFASHGWPNLRYCSDLPRIVDRLPDLQTIVVEHEIPYSEYHLISPPPDACFAAFGQSLNLTAMRTAIAEGVLTRLNDYEAAARAYPALLASNPALARPEPPDEPCVKIWAPSVHRPARKGEWLEAARSGTA